MQCAASRLADWISPLLDVSADVIFILELGAGCRRDEIEAPEALGGIITTSFGPNKAPSGLTKARVSGEQAPLNPYGPPLTADGQSVRCCLNLLASPPFRFAF